MPRLEPLLSALGHHAAMLSASMHTPGLTVLAVAVVLAIGASDARSATRDSDNAQVSIQPLRAASLGLNGTIRIDARFRTVRKGTFRITGAISDAGALTARGHLGRSTPAHSDAFRE